MGKARPDFRALFWDEFGAKLSSVREQFHRALGDPQQLPEATRVAGDYFHRLGGVAQTVGFPMTGELAVLCESICNLIERSHPPGVELHGLIAGGLDALARFFAGGAPSAEATSPESPDAPDDGAQAPKARRRRH
jgi:hypothetical protein